MLETKRYLVLVEHTGALVEDYGLHRQLFFLFELTYRLVEEDVSINEILSVDKQGGYSYMTHPYEIFEGTNLWDIINKGINDLVENNDIEETTQREYIVGYLCKLINELETKK
ncbi:hypothetical protein PGC35_03920 [Psychrobacillus sp. PGGUH221]